jgi:hypothetical protein
MDPGQPFEEALVRKKYNKSNFETLADLQINLTPEDTLDLLPGKYFYAIKIQFNHEDRSATSTKRIDEVKTLVSKTKFIIND